MDGWRITAVEDQVAIDNRPARDAQDPLEVPLEPVNVILPRRVVAEAFFACGAEFEARVRQMQAEADKATDG